MVRDLTEGTGPAVPARSDPGGAVRVLRSLAALLPDFWDAHVYGGGALLAYGLWLAWPPLGFIALGALLVYLGLAWSPRHTPTQEGD